jgi:GntR family transcriptional repressor for pyruvate dehydrogenase complex
MASRKTKAQWIADALYEQIATENRYAVGDKLPTERELVEEFKASRNSIREALKILAARGVVTVIHGSGIYVQDVHINPPFHLDTPKNPILALKNIYEFRLIYEPEIARLAAIRATDEEIRDIMDCALEIVRLVDENQSFYKKDEEFHSLVTKASHNDVMIALTPVIMSFVVSGILISIASGGIHITNNNAREGHLSVARFIAARDEVGAYSAMRIHLETNLKFISTNNTTGPYTEQEHE